MGRIRDCQRRRSPSCRPCSLERAEVARLAGRSGGEDGFQVLAARRARVAAGVCRVAARGESVRLAAGAGPRSPRIVSAPCARELHAGHDSQPRFLGGRSSPRRAIQAFADREPARGSRSCCKTEIWELFRIEGQGELSLAAHDKYLHCEKPTPSTAGTSCSRSWPEPASCRATGCSTKAWRR